MRFLATIRQTIETHTLFSPGDRVLAAVSGGPDSVCLLHILSQLRHSYGFHLLAAHVNHQLREESAAEQQLVEDFCRSLGVKCLTRKIRISTKTPGSLEEKLRDKRLRALSAMARKEKAGVIAFGHHQDDQAETILMRIIRGTGTTGLRGIRPKRTADSLILIRPLLAVTKKDITAYLQKNRLRFCEDLSNRDPRFFRNRIRHQLIPILTSYNPRIAETLANLAEHLAVDYGFLEEEGSRAYQKLARVSKTKITMELKPFTRLPEGLQRLVLRRCLEELSRRKRSLDLRHIREIQDLAATRPIGSIVDLPFKLFVKKTAKNLTFGRRSP